MVLSQLLIVELGIEIEERCEEKKRTTKRDERAAKQESMSFLPAVCEGTHSFYDTEIAGATGHLSVFQSQNPVN